MLARRSRSVTGLLRLCKRSFASEQPPPPASTPRGGTGLATFVAGAAVVAAGVAVYQNRHLFYDAPVHPVVFEPQEKLQTLTPSVEEPQTEVRTVTERPSRGEKQSGAQLDAPPPPPAETEKPAEGGEPPKEDVIPPQIIDNTAIVELFSEALGEKVSHDDPTPSPIKDVDWEMLIGADVDATVLEGKLLSAALKEAVATKPNWPEFEARHKQATYDAAVLKRVVEREREAGKGVADALEQKLKDGRANVQGLEKALASLKQEMEQNIAAAVQKAQTKHEGELAQLRDKISLEATQTAMQETANRHKVLDTLREKVNVLTVALTQWMDQTQSAKAAQCMAVEAAALDKLLDHAQTGRRWIRKPAREVQDPVVRAAMESLPEQTTIPSKAQLLQSLKKIRIHVESLALLPPSGGGLLSQLVANFGARLKLHVPAAYNDGSDVTSRLDLVEAALSEGSVSKAIDLFEGVTRDSGAEHVSAPWVVQAQRYASLQEIRKILAARAVELTAVATSL